MFSQLHTHTRTHTAGLEAILPGTFSDAEKIKYLESRQQKGSVGTVQYNNREKGIENKNEEI